MRIPVFRDCKYSPPQSLCFARTLYYYYYYTVYGVHQARACEMCVNRNETGSARSKLSLQ